MYGNDNYGNSENNNESGGIFSGSQNFANGAVESQTLESTINENVIKESVINENAVSESEPAGNYFNILDEEIKQTVEMPYRNESMTQSYVAAQPMPVAQEAVTSAEEPAASVQESVTGTQEPAASAPESITSIQESAASVQEAPTSTQQSVASKSAWEQAPIRNGSENVSKQEHPEKKFGLMQKIMLCVSLGLLFGIFAGFGFYGVVQATGAAQIISDSVPEPDKAQNPQIKDEDDEVQDTDQPLIQPALSNIVYNNGLYDVSPIVKQVMPAMVSIINNYTEVSYFWGQTYKEPVSSSGSGIIVAENGQELLIVTNQHVVADAEQLLVTLIDNTEVEAKIKGVDADMDLAIIAINLNDITDETRSAIAIAELGDSDELEMGEPAIAIGNALGYGMSVTVGHISALDRAIELDDGSVRKFIQTDAAINPGNSGGALLNGSGQVIGINSNKIGGSSIEGMGYAIPITAASPIIADLMERQTRNKVSDSNRGYMGITPQDVTDQIAQMYGMPKGVYVVSVSEGSGAESAGMKKGDVITKFDGNRISSNADLQEVMQYYAVGDSVKVVVMRPENGEYVEHELKVSLGERP